MPTTARPPLPLKDTTATAAAVAVTPYPAPAVTRSRRHQVQLRAWSINYTTAPLAFAQAWEDHYLSVGRAGAWSWTPPGGLDPAVNVRYVSDLSVTRRKGDTANITFRIQEIKEP